jgi:hypothetical protein
MSRTIFVVFDVESENLTLIVRWNWDSDPVIPGMIFSTTAGNFVRHFRMCGWMTADELAQCFPRRKMAGGHFSVYPSVPVEHCAWRFRQDRAPAESHVS